MVEVFELNSKGHLSVVCSVDVTREHACRCTRPALLIFHFEHHYDQTGTVPAAASSIIDGTRVHSRQTVSLDIGN